MIGFGAVTMEVIYCALAFTGFASFFDGKVIKAVMELASFVFFLYLGIKFLTVRSIDEMHRREEQKLKIKLNPHSAFAIGFVRVMGNFGVFLFWIVLAARFRARGWVQPTLAGTLSCVAGVAAGTSLWFCGLSYARFARARQIHRAHPAAHGTYFRHLPSADGPRRGHPYRLANGPS